MKGHLGKGFRALQTLSYTSHSPRQICLFTPACLPACLRGCLECSSKPNHPDPCTFQTLTESCVTVTTLHVSRATCPVLQLHRSQVSPLPVFSEPARGGCTTALGPLVTRLLLPNTVPSTRGPSEGQEINSLAQGSGKSSQETVAITLQQAPEHFLTS